MPHLGARAYNRRRRSAAPRGCARERLGARAGTRPRAQRANEGIGRRLSEGGTPTELSPAPSERMSTRWRGARADGASGRTPPARGGQGGAGAGRGGYPPFPAVPLPPAPPRTAPPERTPLPL